MVVSGRYGGDAGESRDLHGRVRARVVPVSQGPVAVVAPGPDRAVRPQGGSWVGPRRDRRYPGESAHLDHGERLGVGPVPELTIAVVAPGPDCSVALHYQGVVLAPGRGCARCRSRNQEGEGQAE